MESELTVWDSKSISSTDIRSLCVPLEEQEAVLCVDCGGVEGLIVTSDINDLESSLVFDCCLVIVIDNVVGVSSITVLYDRESSSAASSLLIITMLSRREWSLLVDMISHDVGVVSCSTDSETDLIASEGEVTAEQGDVGDDNNSTESEFDVTDCRFFSMSGCMFSLSSLFGGSCNFSILKLLTLFGGVVTISLALGFSKNDPVKEPQPEVANFSFSIDPPSKAVSFAIEKDGVVVDVDMVCGKIGVVTGVVGSVLLFSRFAPPGSFLLPNFMSSR